MSGSWYNKKYGITNLDKQCATRTLISHNKFLRCYENRTYENNDIIVKMCVRYTGDYDSYIIHI